MWLILRAALVLSLFGASWGFKDEAIFEDEDIYATALPPTSPSTGLTVPGTKWCGPGNTSTSYDDLGRLRQLDMCCRDHDYCDEIIDSETSLHGLSKNTDWFPIMKCSCEQKFLNCLQALNSFPGKTLGVTYFWSRKRCFGHGFPITGCQKYQNAVYSKRCVLYTVNEKLNKVWQYYDTPFFSSKP
ncbi:hypothetical protein KR222_004054 [Zaprionus bogoriensis]|nr:hypothetical protein KR222_004054 [Zaprionus bogoriensis]